MTSPDLGHSAGEPATPLRVLHLEDDAMDSRLIRKELESAGLVREIVRVESAQEFRDALRAQAFDIVLSDFSMPGFDGEAALRYVSEKYPELPFLFVSGTIGEERAIESLKAGATDYVLKDNFSRLVAAVRRAVKEARERRLRAAAQDALRVSEERYRSLFEDTRDAVVLTTPGGDLIDANPAAVEMMGFASKTEMLEGGEASFYRDPGSRAELIRLLESVGFVQDYELELTRKDGSTLTGILTATVKRNEAGEVVAYRSICRDVTEYRKLEADFLRAQRLENLGSLASGIAHDLNNILSPILMGTQLLARRIDDARSRKTLDTIELSATRAGDLVKQILTFARGSGTERRPTQLRGVVRDIHKIAAETFPKSISIVVHVAEDLGMVQGNVTELHQLLMNLAVNARDAMASHGNLRISARNVAVDDPDAARMNLSPGPHVLLEVSDDGEGILEDLREKIFESFFTTKADGAGTGLGLPTVLAIARNHGGAIDLSSEVGKGTTFGIYLPALVSRDAEPAPQTRNLSAGMGQLVLLVDDEAAFREIAAATLETFGYRVLTAADGLDALDLFRRYKEDIRVVLTDLELPRLGGRDLAGRIRRLDGKIPVIGMSGAKPENQKNTVAVPEVFSAFLEKPFSNQEILESLGRALSFGPSSAP